MKGLVYYFHVENFGVLKNVSLRLDKFNLFIGKNMTGKSTLVESIRYLTDMIFQASDSNEITPYYNYDQNTPPDQPIRYLLKFYLEMEGKSSQTYEYQVTIDRNHITYESLYEIFSDDERPQELWVKRETNVIEYKCYSVEKEHYEMNKRDVDINISFIHLLWDSKREPYIQEIKSFFSSLRFVEPKIRIETSLTLNSRPNMRIVPKDYNPIILLIHSLKTKDPDVIIKIEDNIRLIYDKFSRFIITKESESPLVKVEENTYNIMGQIESQQIFDLSWMSDGFIRTLMILIFGFIAEKKHSLFIIDEIDTGLNPNTLHYIIDILCNMNTQIIITSHRYETLDWCEAMKVFVFVRNGQFAEVFEAMTEKELENLLGIEYGKVSRSSYIYSGDETHIIKDNYQ